MSKIISLLGFVYGWFLTWFSYDLSDIQLILRIFDFFISHSNLNTRYIEIVLSIKIIVYWIKDLINKKVKKENLIYKIYENKLNNINYDEFVYILRETNNFIMYKKQKIDDLLCQNHKKTNFRRLFSSLRVI